jgi:3',5'-cyclic AMP phosphodiesterase CpdA
MNCNFIALTAEILFSLISIQGSGLMAHDGVHDGHDHAVIAVRAAEAYAPTATPDRIILTLNQDPTTTQTVNWRTSVEVVTGIAEISPAGAGPDFPLRAKRYEAETQALKTNLSTAHYHSVVFQDLQPGSTYAYRVGDGVNWSEWFHFRTASETPEAFSFIYFGDAQNNIRSMWSRVIREAYRDAPRAAFLLHAGDLINRAESDGEWGEWFGAGGWLNAMTPSVAIPGNHEHVKTRDGKRRLSHHWRKVFTFPENGPRGLEETCFTLTYHNLRIVGLNSSEMHEQQAQWLDRVLSQNESEWVVLTFHHPVFSTGRDRDNPELRAMWKPVIDKYKVDLVLQGHDHTYGRTGFDVPDDSASRKSSTRLAKPADRTALVTVGDTNAPVGVSKVDEDSGTIYVVSVSGPKMYNNSRYPFMKRIAEDTQLYQVIHIDGDRLKYEARTAIGELYDAFELQKQEGKINKLVELEPEISPRLRFLRK